jgi:DNA-binding MarR family transcriptional regulator
MIVPAQPDRESLDAVAEGVVTALRRIMHRVELHSRALMAQCGLTGPQLAVLGQLARGEAVSIGDLTRRVHVSQATVTGILDRLQARGLVTRERSTEDRRRVHVRLTPAARALVAEAPPTLQAHFLEAFENLADWERTQILASLQRVAAMMEGAPFGAAPAEPAAPPRTASHGAAPTEPPAAHSTEPSGGDVA